MDHDSSLAPAVHRLACAISELAAAMGPETQRMSPAAQAALDLLLHNSRRTLRRLRALDASVDPTTDNKTTK